MPTCLFAYGTLQLPEIMLQISGRRLAHRPAVLRGYARFLLVDQCYPAVVARADGEVDGVLFSGVTESMLEHLDAYEGDQYERAALWVDAGSGSIERAWVYVLKPEYAPLLSDIPWDRERFEERELSDFVASLD